MTQIMRVVTSAVVLLALIFGVQVATAQGNESNNASPVAVAAAVEIAPQKVTVVHTAAPKVRPKPKPKIKPKHKPKVVLVKGILPSAYRGKYYDARYEAYRRCVVKRESEGQYYTVERYSGAAGAYQFLPAWTHTIQKWNHHYIPIQKMSRYEQDYAFWRAFDHGKGAHHWAGGRWYCGF